MEFLGVRPGAVSPLAMVNGAGSGVQLWMDAAVTNAGFVHAHPLVNDRTVAIRPGDLVALLEEWGAEVAWLEL